MNKYEAENADLTKLEAIPVIDKRGEEVPNMKINFLEWFTDPGDPMFNLIHLN